MASGEPRTGERAPCPIIPAYCTPSPGLHRQARFAIVGSASALENSSTNGFRSSKSQGGGAAFEQLCGERTRLGVAS